jgi:hypothetical protein
MPLYTDLELFNQICSVARSVGEMLKTIMHNYGNVVCNPRKTLLQEIVVRRICIKK